MAELIKSRYLVLVFTSIINSILYCQSSSSYIEIDKLVNVNEIRKFRRDTYVGNCYIETFVITGSDTYRSGYVIPKSNVHEYDTVFYMLTPLDYRYIKEIDSNRLFIKSVTNFDFKIAKICSGKINGVDSANYITKGGIVYYKSCFKFEYINLGQNILDVPENKEQKVSAMRELKKKKLYIFLVTKILGFKSGW